MKTKTGLGVYLNAEQLQLIHEALDMLETDWSFDHPEQDTLDILLRKIIKAEIKLTGGTREKTVREKVTVG